MASRSSCPAAVSLSTRGRIASSATVSKSPPLSEKRTRTRPAISASAARLSSSVPSISLTSASRSGSRSPSTAPSRITKASTPSRSTASKPKRSISGCSAARPVAPAGSSYPQTTPCNPLTSIANSPERSQISRTRPASDRAEPRPDSQCPRAWFAPSDQRSRRFGNQGQGRASQAQTWARDISTMSRPSTAETALFSDQ